MESKDKREFVVLRIFRGKKNFNEHGEITSEYDIHKLPLNSLIYTQFKQNAVQIGITAIDVIKVVNAQGETIETPEAVKADIKSIFEKPEKELTAEQKEIKELKAQMAELLAAKKPAAKEKVLTDADSKADLKGEKRPDNPSKEAEDAEFDERKLEATRAEYLEVIGKKPSHLMKIETMAEKIKEAKAK